MSGDVPISEALGHLPTLTDGSDLLLIEETERTPEPGSEGLANAPLPDAVEARFEAADQTYPLTAIRTVIGRGPEADIQLNDRKASRKHASVFFTGTEFRIRDEGSANGTLLNGLKVEGYVVRDGDEVTIGTTVLRFRRRPHP